MRFIIEAEGYDTVPIEDFMPRHWVVKCVDKGRLVELHRFFRSPENYIYHRGKHGDQELPAQDALVKHFEDREELRLSGPGERTKPLLKAPR